MRHILILIATIICIDSYCQGSFLNENITLRKVLVNGYDSLQEVRLVVSDKQYFDIEYDTGSYQDIFHMQRDTTIQIMRNIGVGYHNVVINGINWCIIDELPKGRKGITMERKKYHIESDRIDTINFLFNKGLPNEYGEISLKPRTLLYSFLLHKFGYDMDSAVARIVCPESIIKEEHNGFYDIKVYRMNNGKYKLQSRYGSVKYPEGFVVENEKIYTKLGIRNNKLIDHHLHMPNANIDSFLIRSLWPSYFETCGHRFLVSNDFAETFTANDNFDNNQQMVIWDLVELIREINIYKRNYWKLKYPFAKKQL